MKTENVNESFASNMSLATLLAFLAIPGIMPANAIADGIPNKQNVTAADVVKAMDKATKKDKLYGGYSAHNAVNILARTLWGEARGENQAGKKAVASVIWNRAGKNTDNLIKVVFRRKQFSCWNYLAKSKKRPGTYKYIIPAAAAKNPIDKKSWDECVALATELIGGKFISTVTNANAYYVTNMSKKPYWTVSLSSTTNVGHHTFGYLKEYDPSRKHITTSSTYKVKRGDTLSDIANTHNTTVTDIMAKNPSVKNKNDIKTGQVLKI